MSAENAMSIHAIIGVQPTIHKIKNKNTDVFVINKNRMVIFKFFLYFWMVKIMMMLLYRENEKEEREETPLQGEDESRRSSPP